jgi:hypothetical protein
MGDRTWVEIYISKSDYKNLKLDDKKLQEELNIEDTDVNGEIVRLYSQDINYAEWDELEEFLNEKMINYDKSWGAGGDYDAGLKYVRFNKGVMKYYETNDQTEHEVEKLKEILASKDIVEAIKARIKELEPFIPEDLNQLNSVKFIKE